MTPITSRGVPLTRIVRPTMSGRPPNRACQSFQPRTTTPSVPGPSSPGAKVRPSAGFARSTAKALSVMKAPL